MARMFNLGPDRIRESKEYDHVGIKNSTSRDNENRVLEKIGKARHTLNAASGVGIRKNGLNIMSCNVIYWAVVVPILTFGCEIWCVTEKDYDNIMAFQRFCGRRVQRFPSRSTNATSFFGLGWIRLPTFILVKKLLFVMTIVRMESHNVIKHIFLARLETFLNDRQRCCVNEFDSPVFGILNACAKLGLSHQVNAMMKGT